MRLLHTADWHLGARLAERDRHSEHSAFLDWLLGVVASEGIDAVLVAGDVFDAANPPQEAVALYYVFIRRLAEVQGVSAVIVGGNHDSASHLNAPRDLLRHFRSHVFGHAPPEPGACAVAFDEAVVAAVPFLRERELRRVAAGETSLEAQALVRDAIRRHYAAVRAAADELAAGRPVVAMGHLTVVGSSTCDSERDIHVGNLGAVGADIFAGFDYTALGHLHRPQTAGGATSVRYAGSPLALSFSEADDVKSVAIVEIDARSAGPKIELAPVPVAQRLVRVSVKWAALEAGMAAVPAGAWAEITVVLDGPQSDVEARVREAAAGQFDVCKVLVSLPAGTAELWATAAPALEELRPLDVFRARLAAAGLPEDDPELTATFHDLLALHEASVTA